MEERDRRSGAPLRPDGRPAFGLGPIARVPTVAAMARPAMAPPQAPARAAAPATAAPPARPEPSTPRVGVPVFRAAAPPGQRGVMPHPGAEMARARAFGLPNLRRNVCPHFFLTGGRGAIPIHAPHLLKALVRQDGTTSRCQLRGGVHLEQGYVNDVCLSPRFNQCVFYEEELSAR